MCCTAKVLLCCHPAVKDSKESRKVVPDHKVNNNNVGEEETAMERRRRRSEIARCSSSIFKFAVGVIDITVSLASATTASQ